MELKKFLVSDKITASGQINISPWHYLDQFRFLGNCPPKATLTITSRFGQNVGLGEGQVGSFPET